MAFVNFPSPTPIFPVLDPLTWVVGKIPSFTSITSIASSGREVQMVRAVYPRWEFTLSYGGDSWLRDQTQNILPDPRRSGQTEFTQITGLFLQCLGAYGEFYYLDPDDNSRLSYNAGNFTSNVETSFPLYYTWGTGPFTPAMSIPVGGIASISSVYIGNTLILPEFYTTDATNTQLVILYLPNPPYIAVPDGAVTVSFNFYYRCRFLNDAEEFEQWAENLWEKKELKFQSIKP